METTNFSLSAVKRAGKNQSSFGDQISKHQIQNFAHAETHTG